MYTVVDNAITLTRGDTFIGTVVLNIGTSTYTPVEGDKIRFMVKHAGLNPLGTAYKDKEVRIDKDVPYNSLMLQIDPQDTKSLPFGDYVYDLEVTFSDGRVDTVIEGAPFVLTPEVD